MKKTTVHVGKMKHSEGPELAALYTLVSSRFDPNFPSSFPFLVS